ncbi:MAG: acyl-CoA dehydrogenase family protein [Candidatus Eiseniibacteriota bacterium]
MNHRPASAPSGEEAAAPAVQSGSFLVADTDPATVFVPELFSDEERLTGDTVERFVHDTVLPRLEAVEQHDSATVRELVGKLGELGVFLADVPEEWDGLGASKKEVMLISEKLGMAGSFTPAAMVQTGIGGLPIIYFGTDAQRARYLEPIMTGAKLTAYALTEPGSGSDALAARSTARLDPARGVYVLNGTKQFITNAANADIFIVFAKVDGEQFSCFILEKEMPGFKLGPEEKKMGLKGSSTRSLVFDDVEVPEENVLGEVGKGHRIAFNVLNIGRLKLVPSLLGGMKMALGMGARYASEREQFGQPLAAFGLVKQKLAGAAVRIYCTESMCYRTADLIDQHIAAGLASGAAAHTAAASVDALKELAVECSINKVYGSEAMGWIVDEMLQVHGGYGYIEEYPIEGAYRDARINRIWEGTSEINRMIITGTLMKRAMKGELPLLGAIRRITSELMERRARGEVPAGPLGVEKGMIDQARKMTLFAAGVAAQRHREELDQQQEILGWVADMVMQTFAMESAWLRTRRLEGVRDAAALRVREAATRYAVEEGFQLVEQRARAVLAASSSGDELRSLVSMWKKLARRQPIDLVEAGHVVADLVVERGGYPFD